MNLMNIVILSTSSFPWGMAATTRVRCLAKGMMADGINVEYIGLRGADVACTPDKRRAGSVGGVAYSYPGGFAVRPGSWLMRRVDDLLGTTMTFLKLLQMKRMGRLGLVMLYSRGPVVVKGWTRILHWMGARVVLELCEWPLAIAETKNSGFKQARAFCHEAVPMVDGVIPISSYIAQEVDRIMVGTGRRLPSFKIPILIDADRPVEDIPAEASGEPYLVYAGAISYFDIAMLIVDIAATLKDHGIDLPIKFTGGGKKMLFERLRAYAQEKDVLNYFEFTGYISDSELRLVMEGAVALLAPLPENLQSVARFPTKFGYYLSSGTPVVTNVIGDIGSYLEDGLNAYVADRCDAELIAKKIEGVMADRVRANMVGLRGKELAFDRFHYLNACRGIKPFFESLSEPTSG